MCTLTKCCWMATFCSKCSLYKLWMFCAENISWFKESRHTHSSSFANITNVVPSLQCISWFKESKHTHRSSFANITNVVPSLQCIIRISIHVLIEAVLPTLLMLYLPLCISWFEESKHTHRSSFANRNNVVLLLFVLGTTLLEICLSC